MFGISNHSQKGQGFVISIFLQKLALNTTFQKSRLKLKTWMKQWEMMAVDGSQTEMFSDEPSHSSSMYNNTIVPRLLWKRYQQCYTNILYFSMEVLTRPCGPSPRPGRPCPCSSGPPCWCVSSPELPSGTQWWTACRRSEWAAAPAASSSSGPVGQLTQRD